MSPTNNSTGIPVSGTALQWTAVSGATLYEYQYDDNSDFSSPVSNSVNALTESTGTLLSNTIYYWRVRAGNGSGFSPWSGSWSFTTEIQFATAPTLISPADNAAGIPISGITLEWSSVNNATLYEYQYDDNASFTSPFSNAVTTLTASTGSLLPNTIYYWRVRAGNGSGFSPWSVAWSFTTDVTTGLAIETENEVFSVFPNPSSGRFTFTGDNSFHLIEIYTIQGANILQTVNRNQPLELDLSMHPKGVYFVKLHKDSHVLIKKIVIN